MDFEFIEHNKKRVVSLAMGYSFKEFILDESNHFSEFFIFDKTNDYSFYYLNGTGKEKVGNLTIEHDSIFYEPFYHLLTSLKIPRVQDDYSERYLELSLKRDGDILVTIHLLPGEMDGTIELKNIMFDLRSQADSNTKDCLSLFFDELVFVAKESFLDPTFLRLRKDL